MKVYTDSCLFGAWIADWLQQNKPQTQSILDIGCGTGLLSLMLAQKLPAATIDAVEIESLCFEQAKTNISQSHWRERIQIHHCDINEFAPQIKYDVIISNPPFYELDLLGKNNAKNIAHHHAGLTLLTLIKAVKTFLSDDGCFALILPYHRSTEFENLAEKDRFFVNRKTSVKQTTTHSYFRTFSIFSTNKTNSGEDEIAIKDIDDKYTDVFISLLKDYYLYL